MPRGQPLAFGGVRPFCHECKGCSFHGFFAGFDARRFPKGERKALWCARRRSPIFPYEGLTRRRRRGSGTCRPMGLSHFSFDGERKVCKRKPAARHYGKKAFIAHFDGGARNVARNGVRSLSPALGARSCSPFSAVKMSGPFSLRRLSPLVSPAGGAGQTQMAMFGTFLCSLDISAAQKTSVNIESRWPFLFNEHEVTPDRRAVAPVVPRR